MIRRKARYHPSTPRIAIGLSALLALAVFDTTQAEANTAANHKIRNTVTVRYDDSQGTVQTAVTSSTDVTVNLVPAIPTLSAPADISNKVPSDLNAVYTYTITTNANGPDDYNLTEQSLNADAGVAGEATAFGANPINLGASTVASAGNIAAAGNTVITVPADSVNDGAVNGIVATDVVVINGQVFTVDSVDDSNGGTASATSTITVQGNGNLTAIAIGDLIKEQKNFTLTVSWATVVAASNQTITAQIGARDSGNVAVMATDTTVTTILMPSLSVTKYVANITNPVVGGGSTKTVDTGGGAGSITYYTTGVNGRPGDTLEYLIEIANGAGASQTTDLIIEDPIPAFTTYVAGTMRLDPGTAVFGALNDDANGVLDAGEFDNGSTPKKVYIYAGDGGEDGGGGFGDGTGGTLDAGKTTYGVFRVTID